MPEESLSQELSLLEGVAVIMGVIFGCGIFITPKEVLVNTGSFWGSIIIWALCGMLAALGAFCYAELGTTLARGGGDYDYIYEAYGTLPAFLYLWDAVFVIIPSTNAIMALSFANTVLQPLYLTCPIDPLCKKLVAAISICFLTFVNAYNAKHTTRFQNILIIMLFVVLVCIILAGIVWIALGKSKFLTDGWVGTKASVSEWAVAFFAGVFSYVGWSYLNFLIKELKNPYRNLPRAIFIAFVVVTSVYVLVNVSYIAVLGPHVIYTSNSVVLDFTATTLRFMNWIMPFIVGVSLLGALSIHIMMSSRICFSGARVGHMPELFAHINMKCFSPIPALSFLMLLSLVMLLPNSLAHLITYSVVVATLFTTITCSIVIYLRYKRPELERPIKVILCWPIIFVVVNGGMLLVPIVSQPVAIVSGIFVTLCGLP
ncbi:large neutral amino acids transporter small subunit 1-like, partial [Hyposmocoma kahamanoa]|uniref:large neutral amino acids transporter small subunit 1-like n=1 Tax=Hyposmocoma kahamanoa TaxID=1477025 RepID=UPI000E6D908A